MASQRNNQTEAKQETATSSTRLSESIGMALPDGRMRVFLPKGSRMPCEFSQRFLTRLKDYNKVNLQIYVGDNEFIDENYYLGEVGLENIRLNREGEALLDIAFSVNSDKLLKVAITDAPAERTSNAVFRLPESESQELGKPGEQPVRRRSSINVNDELIEKISKLEEKLLSMERELSSESRSKKETKKEESEDPDNVKNS